VVPAVSADDAPTFGAVGRSARRLSLKPAAFARNRRRLPTVAKFHWRSTWAAGESAGHALNACESGSKAQDPVS